MAIDSAQYRVTLHSIILRGTWLGAVWYCAELDSAQYDTAQSQSRKTPINQNLDKNQKHFKPLLSDQDRLELWKKQSKFKLYCPLKKDTEMLLDSVQYDTARNLTRRSMILRRTWLRAVWYCAESISKNSNNSAKSWYKSKIFKTIT